MHRPTLFFIAGAVFGVTVGVTSLALAQWLPADGSNMYVRPGRWITIKCGGLNGENRPHVPMQTSGPALGEGIWSTIYRLHVGCPA
jgi:hypothetical protein